MILIDVDLIKQAEEIDYPLKKDSVLQHPEKLLVVNYQLKTG